MHNFPVGSTWMTSGGDLYEVTNAGTEIIELRLRCNHTRTQHDPLRLAQLTAERLLQPADPADHINHAGYHI